MASNYKKKETDNDEVLNTDITNTSDKNRETDESVKELIEDINTEKSTVDKNDKNDTKSILSDIQSGLQDVSKKDIAIDTKTENAKIKPDELIPVRSMVRGGFNWKCKKSGIWYRWSSIGHVEHVPYEDLYQLLTNNKHYLIKAFLLIEDERVINLFKLIDTYKDIAVVNRLVGKAASDVNVMADICEQAKRIGMRDFLVERLCQMRNNSILTNVDVIEKAQDILKCEISKN